MNSAVGTRIGWKGEIMAGLITLKALRVPWLLLGLIAVFPFHANAASLGQCQSQTKSETDTSVTFYVDNNCDVRMCVSARVTARSNVNGDVISGVLLMQPQEKGAAIGSFASADTSLGWSVNIETIATDECY